VITRSARVIHLLIFLVLAAVGSLLLPTSLGAGIPSELQPLTTRVPLLVGAMAVAAAALAVYVVWRR